MDVAGRKTKLKPLNTSPNVITLDIAHLPAGIYFVKLKTPNGMQTVKFVKMGN